jgi:integrase
MKTLTLDQVGALLEVSRGDRFHALWVILATTGLRLGEALGLKWEDLDLEAATLRVRRQLQRRRAGGSLVLDEVKSPTSRRLIHLGSVACEALRRLQTGQKEQRLATGAAWVDTGLVFTTAKGTPVEQGRVSHHFKRTLTRAELPRVRIHDLRHTAASLMLEQGENPKVVQEMLGHASITLTLGTYSHVLPTMHRQAADRLDARLRTGS